MNNNTFHIGWRNSSSDFSLLIVGGEDASGVFQDSTELICYHKKDVKHENRKDVFRLDKHSFLPDYPVPVSGLIGSVLSASPYFCGGRDLNGKYLSDCFELSHQGATSKNALNGLIFCM